MKNKRLYYLHQKYFCPRKYAESMHILEINELLCQYKDRANCIKDPEWYAKGVFLYFTFEEESYVICPSDIEATGEKLEILSNAFADDLYDIGAYDIYCSGELD